MHAQYTAGCSVVFWWAPPDPGWLAEERGGQCSRERRLSVVVVYALRPRAHVGCPPRVYARRNGAAVKARHDPGERAEHIAHSAEARLRCHLRGGSVHRQAPNADATRAQHDAADGKGAPLVRCIGGNGHTADADRRKRHDERGEIGYGVEGCSITKAASGATSFFCSATQLLLRERARG